MACRLLSGYTISNFELIEDTLVPGIASRGLYIEKSKFQIYSVIYSVLINFKGTINYGKSASQPLTSQSKHCLSQ